MLTSYFILEVPPTSHLAFHNLTSGFSQIKRGVQITVDYKTTNSFHDKVHLRNFLNKPQLLAYTEE
ncbi:MAG: hypothetical protein PUP92_03265, partial [Rhizonema sp. PD38]|nr:hypothetical protein [Rhizonema sp. PD38]